MSGTRDPNLPFPFGYYPAKTDISGYNYNPAGSIPQPVPKVYTVPGEWIGEVMPLQNIFTAGTLGASRTMIWSTPVFDLRPELRASGGRAPVNSVPVWRQLFGVGGKLWIQLGGFQNDAFSKTDIQLTATEFGHIVDPGRMQAISDPQDVTSEIVGPAPGAVLIFMPPGDGYPIRFWRLTLRVDYFTLHPNDPNITLQAAYY